MRWIIPVDEPEARGRPMRGIAAQIVTSAKRREFGLPFFAELEGGNGRPITPGKGGKPTGRGLPPIGSLGGGPNGGIPGLGRKFCSPSSTDGTLKTHQGLVNILSITVYSNSIYSSNSVP